MFPHICKDWQNLWNKIVQSARKIHLEFIWDADAEIYVRNVRKRGLSAGKDMITTQNILFEKVMINKENWKLAYFYCLKRIINTFSIYSHDGPIIGEIFCSIISCVGIWTVFRSILASLHEIKKANNWSIDELIMGIPTVIIWESTLAKSIIVASVLLEVMAESTFSSSRTIVFEIQFFTSIFWRFGSSNLAPNVMWEVAVETILAVSCEIVDTRVIASFNMILSTFLVVLAFFNSKVLLWAKTLNPLKLIFEFLIFKEILVEHWSTITQTIN